ncbi:hypothetical protein CASFOL_011334 [Castilleja foliolosa]|uniref:Uncharacterized protein n=1 Tax=Castilleja foliolosa TaxID=1961234 RepID=A0ABD3DW75_9LAMI
MSEKTKTGENPEKPTVFVPNLLVDTAKATSSSSVPSSPVGLRKAASARSSCLCSPTTHAGSFRCRQHRNNSPGIRQGAMSVGSKLSELATEKSTDYPS